MAVIASIVTPDAMFGVCPSGPSNPPESDSKLVVAKAVRAFINGLPSPVKCSAGLVSAIDDKLRHLLLEAVSRAQANGRKIVKPVDL